MPTSLTPLKTFPISKRWVVVLLLAILAVVLLTNKGLVVVAVVNGRPIFRWQLSKALYSRLGQQTLEGMISEALIADAAQGAGVAVSQTEVDAKVGQIVGELGENVSIEDVLKFQGMTRSDFESQIRLQLTVEKLLGRDIEIAEKDIDNYIATNRATLVATEASALRQEARDSLFSQKVSEKVQPWFLEIKEKAKILRFL